MALTDSNTYIEPTAGTSLNAARLQVNNSFRSVLTNFKSTSAPAAVNLTAAGDPIGEQDGMLYRSETTNALYISDSVHVKSSPVGGNFTRVGIGNRVENGITALAANIASYEIGELVATPSASPSLSGNARLYLITSNSGTMSSVLDVGTPPNNSISNVQLKEFSVTGDKLNVAFLDKDGNSGKDAHLKVGANSGAYNSAIAIGSADTSSNISLVKLKSSLAVGIYAGLNLMDKTGTTYAPMVANVLAQSAIQGQANNPAVLIPAGSMIGWAGATAPTGWLTCDGSAISRTTYAALFAVCGTTFGAGDGTTTFNIPNLKNRALYGSGTTLARGQQDDPTTMTAYGAITSSTELSLVYATNISVAAPVKDGAVASATTSISDPMHNHTVKVPHSTAMYIIKT